MKNVSHTFPHTSLGSQDTSVSQEGSCRAKALPFGKFHRYFLLKKLKTVSPTFARKKTHDGPTPPPALFAGRITPLSQELLMETDSYLMSIAH